jgi:hypothetical protein
VHALRDPILPRAVFLVWVAVGIHGCKPHVTEAECAELVDRYATLLVKDKSPDASAAAVEAEQRRAHEHAAHEDVLRNCATEVQPSEYHCGMSARTPDAFEKCLE